MSKHIMDNFKIVEWCRIEDCHRFNSVPFGVYAITEPMDYVPSIDVIPFELKQTAYIGKSGVSYDTFFYDRKSVKKKVCGVHDSTYITENEHFHRYSLPARRLKDHRHNLINRNKSTKRESSYNKFYESFGFGEDIISKVNVCIVVPDQIIPNHAVPAWLGAVESYFLLRYQYNFGRNTVMNLDHDIENKNRSTTNSHASRKHEEYKTSSLSNFY